MVIKMDQLEIKITTTIASEYHYESKIMIFLRAMKGLNNWVNPCRKPDRSRIGYKLDKVFSKWGI